MAWDWLADADYWTSRLVFQRLLAALYLVAFLSAANQFRALLGEHGITPIPRFLRSVPFRRAPSVFHLHYSDRFFAVLAWTGVLVSGALLLGLADAAPVWLALLLWAVPWALYLSIVNVGQVWYGYGWESLLVETGFLAIFLGPAHVAPPVLVLWLMRWLLFRVEFGAGLIKIRGDPCWRDLTCLYYHHETQPIPGPLSWYFHHLPKPLHKVEVLASHLAQLVVPFALFAPQPIATAAAAIVIVTQAWLMLSGNFSWLNAVTIVLALSVVDDSVFAPLLPNPPGNLTDPPLWHLALVFAVVALVMVLSYQPVRNLLSRRQLMNYSFTSLRLVNTYGAFGSIGRTRHEVVIEGTRDTELTEDTAWREYEFKGKPGDPYRRPRQVAPYHLRLDWQLWFAALSAQQARGWLPGLAAKLLAGDRDTLKLVARDPFPGSSPRFLRATLYRYRFTTWRERGESGAWWVREPVSPVLRTCRLAEDGDVVPAATGSQET
ncbi:lipase maturation factor family protein [Amycolatopsis cihanbeyliensis]|uniref:lipase maturation factor family protein n=1 Tax=Amycolatopsis cihanbeyliensis TaxID=1128664 RepID=UPI00114F51E2|nr:lipase maturation factor family protein [Amycolatopsis cihanbeyliensis]